MTQGELCRRMTSEELSEHIAYAKWFSALPDSWEQASLITAAVMAPHCDKDKRPRPDAFVPIEEAPRHESQDISALYELKRAFEFGE